MIQGDPSLLSVLNQAQPGVRGSRPMQRQDGVWLLFQGLKLKGREPGSLPSIALIFIQKTGTRFSTHILQGWGHARHRAQRRGFH